MIKQDSLAKTYFLSIDYAIKYSFFEYKNKNGKLKSTDIQKIMSRFKISPNMVINYLRDNSQDISYSARYVLGGIASQEYIEEYSKNPKDAVNKLKKYMELIKEDRGIDALKELGVSMNVSSWENEVRKINIKNSQKKNEEDERPVT